MDIITLLPQETENKIFLFMSHPCADMIRNCINEDFEHHFKVYNYKERYIDTGIRTKEELKKK